MPFFFRPSRTSSNSPKTTQGNEGFEKSKGSKIPTMITERDDPPHMYSGDPEDMDIPEFVRTGSYYLSGTDDNPQFKYLQASDVRRQVQQAPSNPPPKYPGVYQNRPYKEHPIVPSPRNGSPPGNYVYPAKPGPVRAFYNESDRSKFDVGYDDQTEPPRGPRNRKPYANSPYFLASYHPAPTYTDTSTLRRA